MKPKNEQTGFTLLEIIITITIASVLAAMMFTYFGTSLLQSSAPIHRLNDVLALEQVADHIIEDFKRNPEDLDTLKGNITNKLYGTYNILYNDFIRFTNRVAEPDIIGNNNILKVTIQNDSGVALTLLFSI